MTISYCEICLTKVRLIPDKDYTGATIVCSYECAQKEQALRDWFPKDPRDRRKPKQIGGESS